MKTSKSPLYQWDVNQSLMDCQGSYIEYVINNDVYRVEIDDGVCMIPDEFFQSGGMKKVYEVYSDGTIRDHNLYVEGRPQPPDYVFTPTERITFDSLVEKVDNAVDDMYEKAESGEFDGADGRDGTDGADGFSPTATVERTTDGVEITITDKSGTTTAEVYDGVSKQYVDEQVQSVSDKFDALWGLGKGILYDWQKSEVDGTVTVPTGAKKSILQGLKGKSVVWNQLANCIASSGTYQGITVTNNNDGSFTFNGTATAELRFYVDTLVHVIPSEVINIGEHKYYMRGCASGGSLSTYFVSYVNGGGGLQDYANSADIGNGIVGTVHSSGYKTIGVVIKNGVTVNNLVFKPNFTDLTQMFGVGNEPTIDKCRQIFADDYYPYNAGELKSVSVSKFTVNSTDYPIVFVGKSAGTVRDEIDLVNKKYIQRVGSVDLGTLSWLLTTYGTPTNAVWLCSGQVTDIKSADTSSQLANGISEKYTMASNAQVISNPNNIAAFQANRIWVSTTSEDITPTGMFYYELISPIETDITEEEITAITASGDTIVFDSEVEVGSVFNHFIALNEVN